VEILIVDNGSTDDTRAIVARYPVTLLVEDSIHTSYAARNCGVRHARGEVVAFTDADCIAAPDWLDQLVAPLADDTVGAALGQIADASPLTLWQELSNRIRPFARPVRRGLATLLTANVAIRRAVLEEVGLFAERLPTAGDVDLGWRIQQQLGLRLVDVPGAAVAHIHRSTLRGVFKQYRRYGLSEIILTTLHRGNAGSTTPRAQLARMFRQLRACASYVLSFIFRLAAWPFRRSDRRELLWPVFLLAVEVGNLAGKISGLARTRYYRRNPYGKG
jgi:cellulose synthase/poly-beta-1,6-N-acetylglucosamine synthase-like glycosyltransferase